MKAVRIHGFNEVATLDNVPVSPLGSNDVLVKIMATALNPLDIHMMSGYAAKFFPIAFPYTLGTDFAGVIEEVGSSVTVYKIGDAVIVWSDPMTGGGLSEFSVVPAVNCVPLPPSMTFAEGASIPTAASTAFHGLFAEGGLRPSDTVLIHAAAGGVGSFAVQFAKAARATVFATASGDGVELVHSLGADQVIDYKKVDFEDKFAQVDLVFDLVGGDTQRRSFPIIRPSGRLISAVSAPDETLYRDSGIIAKVMYVKPYTQRLSEVVGAVADGIKVVIDSQISAGRFGEAIDRQRSGRARGKVLVVQE